MYTNNKHYNIDGYCFWLQLPVCLCECCKWTSNRALPDSSPVPKTPARPRKAVRRRLSGNVVCPSWNKITSNKRSISTVMSTSAL